jgi:hypothetical protein
MIWRRFDPRLETLSSVLHEVRLSSRWIVEVGPDLFAPTPAADAVREAFFEAIGALPESKGRFLLKTAHPAHAVKTLRALCDRGYSSNRAVRNALMKVVLAVYAETQAEFDARTEELFAPRVRAAELARTDPKAAVVLAEEEGALSTFDDSLKRAKATLKLRGPERVTALVQVLRERYDRLSVRWTEGILPDHAHVALYLAPKEPILIGPTLLRRAALERAGGHWPEKTYAWVVAAGPIGPVSGPRPGDPGAFGLAPNAAWPVHPGWVLDAAVACAVADVPFCVPYLGEWAPMGQFCAEDGVFRQTSWGREDELDGIPTLDVFPDGLPTPERYRRGYAYDPMEHSSVKMQAVGSAVVGRSLGGRTFDARPEWVAR